MAKEDVLAPANTRRPRVIQRGMAPGPIYGLGFIGSLFYFWQHAANFGDGVIGLLKAIVWPALLAYKLFLFLR